MAACEPPQVSDGGPSQAFVTHLLALEPEVLFIGPDSRLTHLQHTISGNDIAPGKMRESRGSFRNRYDPFRRQGFEQVEMFSYEIRFLKLADQVVGRSQPEQVTLTRWVDQNPRGKNRINAVDGLTWRG